MRCLVSCVLILAGSITGQEGAADVHQELVSRLMDLRQESSVGSGNEALTSALMAAAHPAHQPSRLTVASLAQELTNALAGRRVPAATANELARNLTGVLGSAGSGTWAVKRHASEVHRLLARLGAASPASVSKRLAEVGVDVRGPEDVPLRVFRPQ